MLIVIKFLTDEKKEQPEDVAKNWAGHFLEKM